MQQTGKGVSNNIHFALDVSHLHIVFSHFQEKSLVGFCRLCSKNEHNYSLFVHDRSNFFNLG